MWNGGYWDVHRGVAPTGVGAGAGTHATNRRPTDTSLVGVGVDRPRGRLVEPREVQNFKFLYIFVLELKCKMSFVAHP